MATPCAGMLTTRASGPTGRCRAIVPPVVMPPEEERRLRDEDRLAHEGRQKADEATQLNTACGTSPRHHRTFR